MSQKKIFFVIVFAFSSIFFTNAEVDICFSNSEVLQENKANLEEVPSLLKEVGQKIDSALNEYFDGTPQNYNFFYFNFSHPAITMEGNFSNGIIIPGIPSVRLWTFKPEGFEIFNVTSQDTFLNGSYDLTGFVGHNLFDIYGNGIFHLEAINFSIAALTGLVINSTTTCFPLTINLYLHDYDNYFHNFMNGDPDLEPLLNDILQSLIPEAIPIMWREAADAADPFIQAIIDKILHPDIRKSLSKLLFILSNNEDGISPEYIERAKQ